MPTPPPPAIKHAGSFPQTLSKAQGVSKGVSFPKDPIASENGIPAATLQQQRLEAKKAESQMTEDEKRKAAKWARVSAAQTASRSVKSGAEKKGEEGDAILL